MALTIGGAWSQSAQTVIVTAPSKQEFNGVWWAKTEAGERSGFLNGVADCMTWTAHKKGFSDTPEQIMDKIDKYYKTHPLSANLNVIDVWQKVANQLKAKKYSEDSGETWTNAHWYLDGLWWRQSSEDEQLGFVEGYLWCLRTQVSAPTESYSRSANYYCRKIDAIVRANPKLDHEAVAVTLHRFRDKDVVAAPQ
ncbi:MAG TPA: hypothetical protein VKF63_02165 [Terracidiphilus sp.]|nr:hypothetical protein [Terracidiphilus sp.]